MNRSGRISQLWGTAIGFVCLLCTTGELQAARPAPPPLLWEVTQISEGLQPGGGTFNLSLLLVKGRGTLPAGNLTLSSVFTDGWGRIFWQGIPVTVVPGDKQDPAALEFSVPYPPLPVGGYLFTGRIADAKGNEVTTIRVPTGRFARFDFRRNLVWGFWGRGGETDAQVQALRRIGLNCGGGTSPDYRFPYRYFRDHAKQEPTERFPEDVVLNPEGTQLDWYRKAHIGSLPADGGLVLALMTDEMAVAHDAPAMRAARLRLVRADAWLASPTISRFNAFFQTDFLSWDEALRDGFGMLNHPEHGAMPVKWTADRQFTDIEAPMMRVEMLRKTQPVVAFAPGATHCLLDSHLDSFNSRAYNNNTIVFALKQFIAAQPRYGLRPGNKLLNLKAAWIDGANFFGNFERSAWTALGTNNRLFLVYGPGDGYGAAPATSEGKITPEGEFLQALLRTIHGLRPVIMETRTALEPSVIVLAHAHRDGGANLMEGLLNCGIMPKGALEADAAARLIFAIDAEKLTPATLAAVRNGAGLVLQGNHPQELAALGIEVADRTAGATESEELDLTPLANTFPDLAGVKVIGMLGAGAKANAGSGFDEVRAGDKLLAITGPVGKGWLLYLNFSLQEMLLPNGWKTSWGSSNLSVLGDPSIPDRNAALVRALLKRAGIPERHRITDAQGRCHPFLRGFPAETHDGLQQYLIVVSESAGKITRDPADPKKDTMSLASDRVMSGRLRLFDTTIKAVRDLRTGRLLPLKNDDQGAEVEILLEAGQGTLLALLPEAPSGTLALHLSQPTVCGIEQLHLAVSRQDDRGKPLARPGHTYAVRFRDPQGREVEALTRWATGNGPHVFSATFAINDPDGEWTVEAEDMTDGIRTQTRLLRQQQPESVRLSFSPVGDLVRGAPNQGVLHLANGDTAPFSLAGLSVACREPGIQVSKTEKNGELPPNGRGEIPLTIEIASEARPGPVLVELRRGESILGGVQVVVPEPYTVDFEPTPYLDGDLILTEIRGTIRTSAAGATTIAVGLTGVTATPELLVNSPEAHAAVPFAIPLLMSRARAQELRGLRNQGIDLTLRSSGLPQGGANYKLNILPLARAPLRIVSQTGGKVSVRINNFTLTEKRVAMTLAPLLEGATPAWSQTALVPPQKTVTLEHPLPGLIGPIDPGIYLPVLDWTVEGATQEPAVLPVETVLEEIWWIRHESPEANMNELIAVDVPSLPDTAAEREDAGWRRVVTESVLWWEEVAHRKERSGRILAATLINAPQESQVLVGYTGPTTPSRVWLNGNVLEMPEGGRPAKTGQSRPITTPARLKAGQNSLILALDLPLKKSPATSLVLLDPSTGKRNRTLRSEEPNPSVLQENQTPPLIKEK